MNRFISLAAALAVLLFLAACGGGGGGSAGAGATGGTLKISVTDAPFPSSYVESASVEINEVRVRNKDADTWDTVFLGSATIDLVPLTGGVAALLVETPLDPGTYDEVRLIVQAGEAVLTPDAFVEGTTRTFSTANGNLSFPSGPQTGIKVKIDNDIVVTSQLSADLVLDFDLSRSFVFNGPMSHAPGVKRVIFTPVVRATNSSTAGTASLDVLSDNATAGNTADDFPLAGATIRLFDTTDAEVAMALTDALGHAAFSIVPGAYYVTIEATSHDPVTFPDPAAVPPTFDVVLANLTDLGAVTLVASVTEIVGLVYSDATTDADANDDTVMNGVLVEAFPTGTATLAASVMTDEQGAFVLASLAPGDYDVTFTKLGWDPVTILTPATVPGTGGGILLLLHALSRDIVGTITDAAAAPVSPAVVTIIDANGDMIGTAVTVADGTYTIPGVPSGSHTLEVDNAGTFTNFDLEVAGTNPVSNQTADYELP